MELLAGGAATTRLAVERALERVVDEDRLRLIVLEPVREERPGALDVHELRRETTKSAAVGGASAAVIEADVGVPTVLVAAVIAEPSSAARAQIVNAQLGAAAVTSHDAIEGSDDGVVRLARSPGAIPIADHVRGMARKALAVEEAAGVGKADGFRARLGALRPDDDVSPCAQHPPFEARVPTHEIADGHLVARSDPAERLAAPHAMLDAVARRTDHQ